MPIDKVEQRVSFRCEAMGRAVEEAIRLFEGGDIVPGAEALRHARMDAVSHREYGEVAEIDRVADEMRAHLSGPELRDFNKRFAGRGGGGRDEGEQVDVSSVGLAVALAGAVALVIAVFLPYVEATSFARVEQNTLIQHGNGWLFIVIAVVAVGAIWRAYVRRSPSPGPVVLGLVAIGLAIYYGTSSNNLRLCVVGSNPLNIPCEKANPGVGVYVAGVGGLLMTLGGIQMLSSARLARRRASDEDAETKICPECAETVKVAARVCKHCGYRFAPQMSAN